MSDMYGTEFYCALSGLLNIPYENTQGFTPARTRGFTLGWEIAPFQGFEESSMKAIRKLPNYFCPIT